MYRQVPTDPRSIALIRAGPSRHGRIAPPPRHASEMRPPRVVDHYISVAVAAVLVPPRPPRTDG